MRGPLVYHPYAGGNEFPKIEFKNVKPGFKIWVDGGVLDYPEYTCVAKQLDCSPTCCMQSYCAPHNGLCLNYMRRSYSEVYIGGFVVMMIVVGIPTCIGTVGFVLNYKFCQHYDEEQDVNVGGLTICECITACFTCGKALKAPEPELDEFMERYKNPPPQEEEIAFEMDQDPQM